MIRKAIERWPRGQAAWGNPHPVAAALDEAFDSRGATAPGLDLDRTAMQPAAPDLTQREVRLLNNHTATSPARSRSAAR
jgi:hypothetical protein